MTRWTLSSISSSWTSPQTVLRVRVLKTFTGHLQFAMTSQHPSQLIYPMGWRLKQSKLCSADSCSMTILKHTGCRTDEEGRHNGDCTKRAFVHLKVTDVVFTWAYTSARTHTHTQWCTYAVSSDVIKTSLSSIKKLSILWFAFCSWWVFLPSHNGKSPKPFLQPILHLE